MAPLPIESELSPVDVPPGAILAVNEGHFPTAALISFCRVPIFFLTQPSAIPSLARPFDYERTVFSA